MNDRDASRRADEPPADPAQADRLDRYLDGLVGGDDRPEPGLDPTLAATARAAQGPAGTDPDGSAVDRSWRDLMAQRPRPQLRTIPTSSSSAALPSTGNDDRRADLSPSPSPARIVARRLTPRRLLTARRGEQVPFGSADEQRSGQWQGDPDGWAGGASRTSAPASRAGRVRAFGNRTMGLVATLALVTVIVLSGTAVWLNAPRATDPPPTFLAGVGATPSARSLFAFNGTPDAIHVNGPIPADTIRPVIQPCTVAPRTLEDVFDVVTAPMSPSGPDAMYGSGISAGLIYLPQQNGEAYRSRDPSGLPSGGPVDPAIVDELAYLYGGFVGCRIGRIDLTLDALAVLSDDALLRLCWSESDPAELDQIMLISFGRQLEAPVDSVSVKVGQPGLEYLYGFRMLADGRVAAWLQPALIHDGQPGWQVTLDDSPANGYVVFVQTPLGWLIDELDPGGRG